MSASVHRRDGNRGLAGFHVLLAFSVMFAFLAARNAPPDFSAAYLLHHASLSLIGHNHRPHFDSDGAQWSAPARRFVAVPPITELTYAAATPRTFSTRQSKGFHFNRPPPVV